MRRHIVASLILILLSLQACSDDTTSPDPNSGGDGEDGFTILSLDRDTVMWEDTVIVTVSGTQSDSFSVFVHTVKMSLDSVWRDATGRTYIRFLVPENTSTAQLRVFDGGTMQASGSKTLVVIPRKRSSVNPLVFRFTPTRGYTGDIIVIEGHDLQFVTLGRRVTIDNVELPIVRWDSSHIVARITDDVKAGNVIVHLPNQSTSVGPFERVEHGGSLLPSRRLGGISINISPLPGATRQTTVRGIDTTVREEEPIPPTSINKLFSMSALGSTDSVVFDGGGGAGTNSKIEIHLKPGAENTVSGTVRVSLYENMMTTLVEMELKNMRWIEQDGMYLIYSYADNLDEQLVKYSAHYQDDMHILETIRYDGGDLGSSVVIYLIP